MSPTSPFLHLRRQLCPPHKIITISNPNFPNHSLAPYRTAHNSQFKCTRGRSQAQVTMRNPSGMTAGGSSASKTTTMSCCSNIRIKRGLWTPKEDEILANYVKKEGEGRWRTLPKRAGLLRCGKSCRLRWMNYLHPSVKRGHITPDEEDIILRLHRLLGNRWALIAGRIPGRTDNEIKNYWNTHLSKKLISQGIDPRTHKPLLNWKPGSNEYAAGTLSSFVIPSHAQNPNPNSIGNNGATATADYSNLPLETRCDNWENFLQKDHDDVLLSFLDSLMNDNEHTHGHLSDAAVISPSDFQVCSSLNQSMGDGLLWEETAGFRSAMGEFKPAEQ